MNKELIKSPVKIMVELPVITNKYSKDDIRNYIDNNLTVDQIRHLIDNPYSKIEFFLTISDHFKRKEETMMNVISEVVFVNRDIVSIEMFYPDLGEVGMKEASDLSKIAEKDIIKALDKYFGKAPKIKDMEERKRREKLEDDLEDPLKLRLSDYKQTKDLCFILKPKSTGVKAINYESSKDYQSNNCSFGSDIPSYLLERSLSNEIIDPNYFFIPYKLIAEAMDTIDPKSYVWIHVFYDPLRKFKERDLEKFRRTYKWQKRGNKQSYNNAYNKRTRALIELSERIIIIQKKQKALNN